jgi:type IV pilus assembly protein PilY1
MVMALTPVAYASDTEIYTDSTKVKTIAPNLMMLFDTSGSMSDCMTNNNDCSSVTNLPSQRMATLKKAMHQILRGDSTANPPVPALPGYVKMGLARYHPTDVNKGGYVMYPTRPLDAFVSISPTGALDYTVLTSDADAIQKFTDVGSGTVTTGALKIGLESTNDYVSGLQFSNVRVPKGATVTDAYIELTSTAAKSETVTWDIAAEATGNASTYGSSQINSRTYGAISYYQPPAWANNERVKIPVTAAVNEVVNRSDWCGGNALSLRIRDTSTVKALRTAYSMDSATTAAQKPTLHVVFSVDPEATNSCMGNVTQSLVLTANKSENDVKWLSGGTSFDATSNTLDINYVSGTKKREVGLRFQDVDIPVGATINSAVLTVYGAGDYNAVKNAAVQPIRIYGFADADVNFCPSSCLTATQAVALAKTTASAVWTPTGSALSLGVAASTPIGATGDITNIVKEIVGSSDWGLKKHIGFKLYNDTTTNTSAALYNANKGTQYAARLTVSWTIAQVTQLTTLQTVRDQLDAAVDTLDQTGGTPLGAAFSEASRYMYSLAPFNPSTTLNANYDSRVVANAASATTTYVSPIPTEDNCSASYIFLLTDGEPNNESSVKTNTSGVTGATCSTAADATANWECMKKLATYNNDVVTKAGAAKKRIFTSTMILGPLGGTAETNMKEVATLGNGKAYTATKAADLVNGLLDVVEDAIKASGSVTAAGVAVNQLNRLNHLDQLYYAVFEPKAGYYHWEGNVKRYRLGSNGTVIYDNSATPINAVDSSTGFFQKTAKSFWSTAIDGDIAVEGGAASQLPLPTDRKMFTYMGALTAKNVALTTIDTSSASFNTAAQTATGMSGDSYTNLMNWYKGYEVPDLTNGLVTVSNTALRKRIGAALHSQPLLVNYGYTGGVSAAGNADNQNNYLFFSTLEGTLHSVNAKTGIEKFSFIPSEKLSNLKDMHDNPSSALPQFGMDLTWTFFRKDTDSSGQIGSGDKVYLYGGMRMGGDNYYALDVTDLDAPKLLFAVDGGTGKYANMGQTWSQPVVTTVKIAGAKKKVLVFGGGYDPRHEGANEIFTGNDKGNQVYMLDAFTGELLWFASGNSSDNADKYVADMKYSVPSGIQAVDVDGDGTTDAFYFGDLGGQVFRIDLDKTSTTNTTVAKRVRQIAKVGQTESATVANQRRFYEPPKAAIFTDSAGTKFATIAIGSGYRSHPLNTITKDRFFVLFDYDLPRSDLGTADDSTLKTLITTPDLVSLDMASTTVKTSGVNVTNKRGWYVDLPTTGEKSLASGLIYQSKLVFTTYAPKQSAVTNCSPITGITGVYTFCMPYGNLCSTTPTGYFKDNVTIGLGGEPQLLVVPEIDTGTGVATGKSKVVVLVGTGIVGGVFDDLGQPTITPAKKWREKTRK